MQSCTATERALFSHVYWLPPDYGLWNSKSLSYAKGFWSFGQLYPQGTQSFKYISHSIKAYSQRLKAKSIYCQQLQRSLVCREPVTLLHIEIVFLSHWFVFVSTEPFATLISFCANGIRVVSGLISAGSYFSECPLMLAQRLAPQQPSVTSRVISPNTWCPWDMFSLFRELKDFERNCHRWQNCLWEHSRWWSRCKKYKKKCFSSLIFFLNHII